MDDAYAAGCFAGEGSVCLIKIKKRKYRRLEASVYNSCEEFLGFFEFTYSGKVYFRKKRKKHCKREGMWRLRDSKAFEFLKKMHPYLKEKNKRKRIELLMKHFEKFRDASEAEKRTEAYEKKRIKYEDDFLKIK